jgi:hypothetical protein
MRHSLANHLAECGVKEEQRAALLGQAVPGGGENARRYVKLRRNPAAMSAIVEANLGAYAAILDEVMASD